MTHAIDVDWAAEFRTRWNEANEKGMLGERVPYALSTLLTALSVERDRVDRAEARLAQAPHSSDCDVDRVVEAKCSCWKEGAVSEPMSLDDQTTVIRKVDVEFERIGVSSRHWVRLLHDHGYEIAKRNPYEEHR